MNAADPQAYTIAGVDAMRVEMSTPLQPSPLHLSPVEGKIVDLNFDGGRLSADGGLGLLNDPDDQIG